MHLHDNVLQHVDFTGVHVMQPYEEHQPTWQSVWLREPRL
jgi:hypothetical protein